MRVKILKTLSNNNACIRTYKYQLPLAGLLEFLVAIPSTPLNQSLDLG